MEKENFSLQEVADKLGCSKKTVQRLVESGKIQAHTIAGGTKQFVKKIDLEEFIKNNETIENQEQPEQLRKDNNSINKKEELFKKLWTLATRLRGQMEGWDFKNYILGMMFYRYISEHFAKVINDYEAQSDCPDPDFKYENLEDEIAESQKTDLVSDYGYFIKPSELFINIYKNAKSNNDLNITLNNIFRAIESSANGTPSEDDMKGLFSDINFSNEKLGKTYEDRRKTILGVMDAIAGIELVDDYGNIENDLFGDAYEYLMGMYASEAGRSGGEYFTPQEVSEIIARIGTYGKTKINGAYDPTCGSGSLLLKAAKVIGVDNITRFCGQELNSTTYNLCRINMHLHGVNYGKFDIKNDDTLLNPQHLNEKFELIVANPPYSLKAVDDDGHRRYDLDINDARFAPAGVVAPDNALDYAFVMHILYHLAENGTALIVLPLGAFHRSNKNEDAIRKYLVDYNFVDGVITLPENVFYGTGFQTGILVLKKNKTTSDILFVDGSKEFEKVTLKGARRTTKNVLRPENINNIVKYYTERKDVEEKAVIKTNEDVKNAGYNICSNNYIKTEKELTSDDFIETTIDYYQYQINAGRNNIKENIKKEEE